MTFSPVGRVVPSVLTQGVGQVFEIINLIKDAEFPKTVTKQEGFQQTNWILGIIGMILGILSIISIIGILGITGINSWYNSFESSLITRARARQALHWADSNSR